MFLTSIDLKEGIARQFKKLAVKLLICLFLINSLFMNDSANFQCGKASSSRNAYILQEHMETSIFPSQ